MGRHGGREVASKVAAGRRGLAGTLLAMTWQHLLLVSLLHLARMRAPLHPTQIVTSPHAPHPCSDE